MSIGLVKGGLWFRLVWLRAGGWLLDDWFRIHFGLGAKLPGGQGRPALGLAGAGQGLHEDGFRIGFGCFFLG